jgi:tRNA-specific 2-thiouridylase
VRKKVLVGMSGGVDSSVAASLLGKKYEVMGAHLNLACPPKPEGRRRGCARNARQDARNIASKLNIPFYSLDLKKEFEEKVINYFVREYSKGHTPNPCVVCNKEIKFKALLEKAKEWKADYIATGHYAKVTYNKKRKRYLLKKGRDRKKDQSYVLCRLNQKQLEHTLFPLGNLTKEEVRRKARELGIHNRPSSQEICFAPDADYRRFLETRISTKKEHESTRIKEGLIVDRKGKVLGRHKGIAFYTIGQRRGLGIALGKPQYVIAIDSDKDVIVVGSEEEILRDELIARNVNWIAINRLKKPMKVRAKIRYQHREAEALIIPLSGNRMKVKFEKPQRAITPGQVVVFYDKDVVIGGGWIV